MHTLGHILVIKNYALKNGNYCMYILITGAIVDGISFAILFL